MIVKSVILAYYYSSRLENQTLFQDVSRSSGKQKLPSRHPLYRHSTRRYPLIGLYSFDSKKWITNKNNRNEQEYSDDISNPILGYVQRHLCDDRTPRFITFHTTIQAIFFVVSFTISTKPIFHETPIIQRNIYVSDLHQIKPIHQKWNTLQWIYFIRFDLFVIQHRVCSSEPDFHRQSPEGSQWSELLPTLWFGVCRSEYLWIRR